MKHTHLLRARAAFHVRAVVACALMLTLVSSVAVSAKSPAVPGSDTGSTGAQSDAASTPKKSAVRGPHLTVTGPASVQAGEPITYDLTAVGVRDLGGFEVVLEYDRAALEFAGTEHLGAGFTAAGRGVIPLGPVDTASGVAIGAYSCPIKGCKPFGRATQTSGPSGTVKLGSVRLLPSASGAISVHLANVVLVDTRGRALNLARQVPDLAIRVGAVSRTLGVPQHVGWRLGNGSVPANARADLNRDGSVTYPDVSDVGIAWDEARLDGNPCVAAGDADVNRDGCVDITDVQFAASQMTRASRGQASIAAGNRTGSATISAADASTSTFTVTSTGDQADSTPGDGNCSTSSGCTLRAAITESNLHAGPDTINFAIPGTGIKRINVATVLPTINDVTGGTTVDGYTQTGAAPNTDPLLDNAAIRVEVRATGFFDVFIISSANNTLSGMAIFNGRQHVVVTGPAARNNTLSGSFIGTDAPGTFVAAYVSSAAQGIYIEKGAAFNQFGVPDLAGRNIVSGNGNNGYRTWHDMTDFNRFQNNLVGLGPTGNVVRNGGHGIDINAGSSYNLVGGTGPLQRNVFSGNRGEGIEISHGTLTVANQAVGNFIGTDVTGNAGTLSTGNGSHGVHIEDGPVDNIISDNVIGYNGYRTDSNGGGIGIEGFYTAGNRVTNNRVGISLDGTAIPNDEAGIRVFYHATWTFIGPGNISAYNPTGVEINGALNFNNVITRNSIFRNTNLGIFFGSTGANHDQVAPTLTAASTTAVAGTSCAGCTVEIFVAEPNSSDTGGGLYGQGKSFVGWGVVPGNGQFSIPVSGVQASDVVTATATSALQDTSKFSRNLAVGTGSPPPPTTPPPPPPPTGVVASDSFSRTTTDSWGSAPIGGGYAYVYCTAYDLDIGGSNGTMSLPNPQVTADCPNQPGTGVATNRGAWLIDTSARDVDMTVRVRADKAAAGDNQNIALSARHWRGLTEYRPQFRFSTAGEVWMQAYKQVTGTVTGLGINTKAPGALSGANRDVLLRVQVTGINPTTIRMKAWNPGQTEPSSWAYVVTDSDAQLQRAGSVGLEGWLAFNATNAPVVLTFDDYLVTTTDIPPPVADFTSTQPSGTVTEQFTDTSSNSPTSWSWDFGDGTTSTQQSPSHTYAGAGTYTVALTATNGFGSNTRSRPVTVAPIAPVAEFTWAQTAGTLGVQFTDGSTGAATSWSWDFGDGATSMQQSPSHTYASAGSKSVTLTVGNAGGNNSVTHPVAVVAPPVANFSSAQTSGTLTVAFTDTSTGSPTSWTWDFGDGQTSTEQSPTHVYASSGTYPVTMSATNLGGTGMVSKSTVVNPVAPTADFIWAQTPGTFEIAFTDTSQGAPSAWSWDFGDSSPASNAQNPRHTYLLPGNYNVTLTADNTGGTDSRTKSVTVNTVAQPTASFRWTQESGSLAVDFTDTSTGASSWAWTFGDGGTSAQRNPTYTYAAGGTYTVTLTATNLGGSDTATDSVVVIGPPTAGFAWSQNDGTRTIAFQDTSSGSPTGWSWDFGDGASSIQQNPNHTYATAGPFSVTLTATTLGGSDSRNRSVSVVMPPSANFTSTQESGSLTMDFTDSSSGSPTSWSWTFGDGGTSTQRSPSHPYAAGGTYSVSLTASTLGGSDTRTKSVTVVAAPVANFSSSQTSGTQTIIFTDTSTGTPTGWSWTFGDGATSSAQNPSHTYASTGNYNVSLTATNVGGSNGVTRTVTVNVSVYAADTFTRSRTDTWGSADTGGAYTYAGSQADFDVNGSVGTLAITSPGASRGATLLGVSARDVDVTLKFKLDKLPNAGSGVYVYSIARQTSTTTEYRVKIRIIASGQAYLSASKLVSGTETTIGSEIALSPLVVAGVNWSLHTQLTGSSPTTIRARAWRSSNAEPSSWQYSQTDSAAGLQQAGAVGFRGYASSGSTNVPFLLSFDDYRVVAP